MRGFAHLERELAQLREQGTFRQLLPLDSSQGARVKLNGREVIQLSSNNYLGLTTHPRLLAAAQQAVSEWGAGTGSVRTIVGTFALHEELERRLAAFKHTEAALVFQSGFTANVGVLSTLLAEQDVVISDEWNHASIIDGIRLTKAARRIYKHCDMNELEQVLKETQHYRTRLVVTDGVFSMDGDVAPLPELVELARRYDVRLVVDEAHGTGTLGPGGRGAVAEAGCEDGVDVIVGTLGKALGSYGAYVACDHQMARYLTNAARALIYSTAPAPPAVAGALAALSLLGEQRAASRSCRRTRRCCAASWRPPASRSTPTRARRSSRSCSATPTRPPSVPRNSVAAGSRSSTRRCAPA